MARLISCATGNFTTSTTWALVDSTSLLDSEASNTPLTTSYVESQSFTPGAITIDGIAVKLASSAGGANTISVRLATGGVLVAGTEVTLNQNDLPTCTTTQNEGGWIFFKFAAPVVLLAATAYTVSAKQSLSSPSMNLYRNATSGNWSRMLRTATTQAPASADILHVLGEKTGAGTSNSFVVTMDSTATTQYGAGTDAGVALTIGHNAILRNGTSPATNYYLKLGGNLIGYNGGRMDVGESGTEIPRDSTAVIEFNPVLDGGMGFERRNGFTFNGYGLSRSSGKNIVACKLTSNLTAGATTLNVDTDTGWLSGDSIAIAKTTATNTRLDETRVLNGAAGASSMDITVALANTHHGTAPYEAHVVLRTRNVIIRSATSTIAAYSTDGPTAVTNMSWVSMQYMGSNNSTKGAVTCNTTTGSVNMQYCSIVDSEQSAFIVANSGNNVTVQNCVIANTNSSGSGIQGLILFGTSLGSSITFTDNYIIGFTQSGGFQTNNSIRIRTNGINFSRNVISSNNLGQPVVLEGSDNIGTFDDNTIYGCSGTSDSTTYAGALIAAAVVAGGTINRLKMFRNNGSNLTIGFTWNNVTFTDCTLFGASGTNISVTTGVLNNCTFNNLTLAADSVQSTTNGIRVESTGLIINSTFNNCNLGIASGQYVAHTNDVAVGGANAYVNFLFNNCNFGSANTVSGQSLLSVVAEIKFHKFNQTTNDHRWYTKYGIARSTGSGLADTTVRTSGSLGLRIAPTDSTAGFTWQFNIPAKANSIINFFAYLQKNAAFGTDDCTIELYLPGSTTPDDTTDLSDVTGSWQAASLSANYTSSIDSLATIKIIAKTATSAAYLYVDDLFNGGNGVSTTFDKVTGLDTWYEGKPIEIIGAQAISAADVWTFSTTNLTAPETTGKQLKDALTLTKFLALK